MPSSESPLVFRDLLQRARTLPVEPGWEALREGVRIRRLYQAGETGPAAALLHYEPGAGIPAHEHMGFEHILVLDGSQADEHGSYSAGTLIINRPHSAHRVASPEGCIVLIIWQAGVRLLNAPPTGS